MRLQDFLPSCTRVVNLSAQAQHVRLQSIVCECTVMMQYMQRRPPVLRQSGELVEDAIYILHVPVGFACNFVRLV